jgi:hypothetical protein
MRHLLLIVGPVVLVACCYTVTYSRPFDRATRRAETDLRPAPVTAASQTTSGDPLEQRCHALALQMAKRVGAVATSTLVRAPFVIQSDLPATKLATLHAESIQPLAEALWRTYFDRQPSEPLVLLLCSHEALYRDLARQFDGYDPIAYDGYFQRGDRRLMLNLASGEGTLAHELCHALAAADAPHLPEWFDEGLAALHEQIRFSDDRLLVWGEPNWRCRIVQDALAAGSLPRVAEFVGRSSFRGDDEGLNYAFARSLCLFLQERGLLAHYVRKLRSDHSDPSRGLTPLQRLLGVASPEGVDAAFHNWLLLRRDLPASESQ